jgi:hypothetical protein
MEDISPQQWQETIGYFRQHSTTRSVHCPLCGGPAAAFLHEPAGVPRNFFTWVQTCEQECAEGKPMFVTAAHVFPHEDELR